MSVCQIILNQWKTLNKNEKFVCISGISVDALRIENLLVEFRVPDLRSIDESVFNFVRNGFRDGNSYWWQSSYAFFTGAVLKN